MYNEEARLEKVFRVKKIKIKTVFRMKLLLLIRFELYVQT